MSAVIFSLIYYLIGSFPTGYLIGRLNGVTIWQHGSGSIGATNVSRVLGKKAGIQTLIGDMLKGLIPIMLLEPLGFLPKHAACLGMFLVLGHCLSIPPFLKGGKGIATALGVFIALSPTLAILSLSTFIICMLIWRIVSLASVIAAIMVPIYAMLVYPEFHQPYLPWLVAISAIVIFRHRGNLQRLSQGQEPRFSFKK